MQLVTGRSDLRARTSQGTNDVFVPDRAILWCSTWRLCAATQRHFVQRHTISSKTSLGLYSFHEDALIRKDVELVLMPVAGRDGAHWTLDSRLTQRHVKNNKDPENSV